MKFKERMIKELKHWTHDYFAGFITGGMIGFMIGMTVGVFIIIINTGN